MKKIMGMLFLFSSCLQANQYNRYGYQDPMEYLFQLVLSKAYNSFVRGIKKITRVEEIAALQRQIDESSSLNASERERLQKEIAAKEQELAAKKNQVQLLHSELERAKASTPAFSPIVSRNSPDHQLTESGIGSPLIFADQRIQQLEKRLQEAHNATEREIKLVVLEKDRQIDRLREEIRWLRENQEVGAFVAEGTDADLLRQLETNSAEIDRLKKEVDRKELENNRLRREMRVLEEKLQGQEDDLVEGFARAHSPVAKKEMLELVRENERYKEVFGLIAPHVLKMELPDDVRLQLRIILGLPAETNENGEEVYE